MIRDANCISERVDEANAVWSDSESLVGLDRRVVTQPRVKLRRLNPKRFIPMLARMYKKRLAGYSALGYVVANGFAD